ncbi:MAG: aminoacyl-histidine dipeptidase [Lachnospiraceae bacterium]|nr:aminoacyl-histidine dipeptidase [Lachnospiraceae bacterium]
MSILSDLEPKKVFEFFEYISSVPRGSGNTSKVSDLCVKFASDRGLVCFRDKLNNVIIYKQATLGYENVPPVIIQGHMDMVCAKTADCKKDMAKEPIDLMHDDKYVFAKDTTLGGDDGIAIAYAMAVLDSDDIKHPAIEAVFTIDEEVGMDGAAGINPKLISGRSLLNIDSEVEGVFTCGCAGGCRVNGTIPVKRTLIDNTEFTVNKFVNLDIELCGLKGGHSGIEIDKQPASASYLLGRLLRELSDLIDFRLIDFYGGEFDNVICEKAKASVAIRKNDVEFAKEFLSKYEKILFDEYAYINPDITLKSTVKNFKTKETLDKPSTIRVLNSVYLSTQGVIEMSQELKGMVQTSQNLGVIKLEKEVFNISFLVRSSVESQKETCINRIKALIKTLHGKVTLCGNYPGWKYKKDSPLREACIKAYKKCYGKKPVIDIIHAGLECGLFVDKLEGLDAISFGPNILDIHTPNERLDIASVGRVWKMLLNILESMK